MPIWIIYEVVKFDDGSEHREPKILCLDEERAETEKLICELEYGDSLEVSEQLEEEPNDYVIEYEIEQRTFKTEFNNIITL